MIRTAAGFALAMAATAAFAQEDPYLWLEDVTGEKPIAWAKALNAESTAFLEGRAEFKPLHERLLSVYNSRERIPFLEKRGAWYYNFWQDAENPRGVYRRTTLEEYRKPQPKWEAVIDLGKLSEAENEKWVLKGVSCLHPTFDRCLVALSRAGADATVVREFDMPTKSFVKGGFETTESKQTLAWRDADTVYVARDFGPGTLTQSGYPRVLKEWKRGTPVSEAKTVYEGKDTDVGVSPVVVHEKGRRYERFSRTISTRTSDKYLRVASEWKLLDLPQDSDIATGDGWLYVKLRSDWKPASHTYKAGALLAINLDRFLAGSRDLATVFDPKPRLALQAYTAVKGALILDVLDNVNNRIVEARPSDGAWKLREVRVPKAASISVSGVDDEENDLYWLTVTSFLEPTTLYLAKLGSDAHQKLRSLPTFFDAKGLRVVQHQATSKDGTKVPYFLVMRADAKLDGSNPTILYGYGGFEQAMLPSYSGTIGSAWLEKGGAWALANLRGGGEFGPEWHQVARREGRQKTHDDFAAIAEDLIARKVTSPRHLGIMGGSQGGLLVGAVFTQRPELFRAVVCQVPLLDMKRYNKLLAGASWMGEYGNPDEPGDWEFISKYSPYQNVVKDKRYPRIFFTTSTRDDRVHPGHARKMVAKMKEQGHDVLYFEYMEGGHAAGTNPTQQAYTWALTYEFFLTELR
jgi:prolyl oligopeptidase